MKDKAVDTRLGRAIELFGGASSDYHIHPRGGGIVAETAEVNNAVYIGENAVIAGHAEIYGHAKICGVTKVSDNAKISGNARIYGHARIYEYAKISHNVELSGGNITSNRPTAIELFRYRRDNSLTK